MASCGRGLSVMLAANFMETDESETAVIGIIVYYYFGEKPVSKDHSFDIVSKINTQELKNPVQMA